MYTVAKAICGHIVTLKYMKMHHLYNEVAKNPIPHIFKLLAKDCNQVQQIHSMLVTGLMILNGKC